MKTIHKAAVAACLLITLIAAFTACGNDKMTDSRLLEIPDKGVLGMTVDEVKEADPGSVDPALRPSEKDMDDGTYRLKYVYGGDAFVEGGNWFTNVCYYFTDGKLTSYQIEYRQSDYSEGMCKKRMQMFTDYLDEKYGDSEETYVVMGEYAVKGQAWRVNGGILDMSRQNGGWILFTYHGGDIVTLK